ncbi:MAG: T9SS type A sorting domain-containing protein [Cytophagaceae bacterium]
MKTSTTKMSFMAIALMLLLSLFSFDLKAQYSITITGRSPVSGMLAVGERVNVSFSYKAPRGNLRIHILPFYKGVECPGYGVQGSPLYSAASGTGTSYFTLHQEGKVDQIRFRVYDGSNNTILLYEVFVNVAYGFVKYGINAVVFTPASGHRAINDMVKVSFRYAQTRGSVRIHVLPFVGGREANGWRVSGSPLYTAPSGSGNAEFSLSIPGNVDQLQFEIYDGNNNTTLLYKTAINVNFQFHRYHIHSVRLNPVSPATIAVGSDVNISFNYVKTGGDVRIFARPMYQGALTNYGASGSPLYTTTYGNGTGIFTLRSAGKVDQVRFQVINASTNAVLHTSYVAVNYTFTGASRLSDMNFDEDEKLIEDTESVLSVFDHPEVNSEFSIAPVPAIDEVSVINNFGSEFNYQLWNMEGFLIREGISSGNEVRIDVSLYPAGTYILKTIIGAEVTERRIVVQ